jgi:hypothetical protein
MRQIGQPRLAAALLLRLSAALSEQRRQGRQTDAAGRRAKQLAAIDAGNVFEKGIIHIIRA